MTKQFRFFALSNPLPNGGIIVAQKQVAYEHAVVVCRLPHNELTPYVTWAVGRDGDAYWGHYFKTFDEAIEDWRNRA